MMMMIGNNPTVQIPYTNHYNDDPTSHIHSPSPLDYSLYEKAFTFDFENEENNNNNDFDIPIDAFSCDNFRMFDFKVKKCTRARSHDWVECPYAHPGEKARRRDPRKFHYSGSACPEYRKGTCRKGDACEFSHGVFECWLHPARYRTLPCKDGTHCRRKICFFAHTPDQLRVLSPESSPSLLGLDSGLFGYSPPSSPVACSPPLSPAGFTRDSVSRLSELTRGLRISGLGGMGMSASPPGWRMGVNGVGSPRSPVRPGFMSLPTTPFVKTRSGLFDFEEDPVMERVESGKDLRERIYAKIGKENPLERTDRGSRVGYEPDVGWVMDLVN